LERLEVFAKSTCTARLQLQVEKEEFARQLMTYSEALARFEEASTTVYNQKMNNKRQQKKLRRLYKRFDGAMA